MAKKKIVYAFGVDMTEFEKGIKKVEYKLKRMSDSTAHLGRLMTRNITAPLAGIGALAVKESISFESAFANVKKTVIGTNEQLTKLKQGILKMSTEMPTSAKEIAGVAAQAGQLGIETENVLNFTKAMIQLGETSNMSAGEAADALARFSNITGMSQKDFDRLASTVVALGNSLATTEAEVVQMGLGLAGAGKQIGMTEPEILAFAGSLSSVGIEAERGGSAFSRLMMQMKLATVNGGQALNDFASISGMTASQFKTQFEKDASGAIIKFIQGLAGLKGTGVSAIEVLERMGITEIRMRDAILRATGASDMFTKSLEMGRVEWEKNNAIQKKTAEFYKTTEAQLKMLRNQITLTGIEIGDTLTPSLVVAAEEIRNVVKAFSELSPELKTNIVQWGLAAAAIGPLLIMTSKAIAGFKELLLNARKFTTFIAKNPALLAVAAMVGTYSAMDKSPGAQETLSERRGLGTNLTGKSAETQALRDLQALTASNSTVTSNSLAAVKAFDKVIATGGAGKITATVPVIPNLDGIGGSGGGSRSGKTAAEKALERIKKKAQEAGIEIAAALSRLEAQNAAMEEAKSAATEGVNKYYDSLQWENSQGLLGDTEYLDALKRQFSELGTELEGLGIDIQNVSNWSEPMRQAFSEIQTVAGGLATDTMDLLQKQFESGTMTNAQYLSALEAIKVKFIEYPSVVKMAEEAIQAFNLSAQASLPTVAGQVQSAWDDMNMAIAQAPSAIGDAFISAIRGSENLGDAMRNLLQDIGAVIVKAFIMKSLFGGIGGTIGGGGGLSSLFGSAKGNVFNQSGLVPFANGGIVNKPTLFPFASGVGLMGEAGAEAIMPLKRTSSGDLGVQADGGNGMTNITMNINAVDSKSFVEMMRTNRASVESIVVENIMRNGAVRGAIRGMA